MKRLLVLLLSLAIMSQVEAVPTGVGDIGDNGCVCHGAYSEETKVNLSGLPDVYNSTQSYNLTLTIESSLEANGPQGGFRILISHGEITGDAQELEEGYTHSSSNNNQRTWELIWTAPESDAELVTFITYGNAVNGNGAASGDEWNSNSYAVPGPNYEGEIVTPITEDSISSRQLAVGAIGIIAVLSLTVMAVKD